MSDSLNEIHNSIEKLSALGYAPYQIRYIIEENTGIQDIQKLDEQQLQELLAAMAEYISFAVKCKSGR